MQPQNTQGWIALTSHLQTAMHSGGELTGHPTSLPTHKSKVLPMEVITNKERNIVNQEQLKEREIVTSFFAKIALVFM